MSDITNQLNEIATGLSSLKRSIELKKLRNARLLARSGKYSLAYREIESHTFKKPQQKLEASLLLAKIFAQQGIFDNASAYWKNVLRSYPENQEALLGLAAISRQKASPPLYRALKFIGVCFLFIFTVVGLSAYLNNQVHHFTLRIASVENNIRNLTLSQADRMVKNMGSAYETYIKELTELSTKSKALMRKVDSINEQSMQRDQLLETKLTETFSEIRNETKENHQTSLSLVTTFETKTAEQNSLLLRKSDSDLEQLRNRLKMLELSIDSNIRAASETLDGNISRVDGRVEVIEDRLNSIGQKLELVLRIIQNTKSSQDTYIKHEELFE